MKKIIIMSLIVFSILIYFVIDLAVLPEKFITKKQLEPKPILSVLLSNQEIKIGQSFTIEIISKNKGDYADILIASAAFPNLQEIGNTVEVVSYDFSQSPNQIKIGEKIGAKYGGGKNFAYAKYPFIEAMSRPSPAENEYHMTLRITPQNSGIFDVYVKSFAMPHTTDLSHYPYEGMLDHQEEFVEVYSVKVNP